MLPAFASLADLSVRITVEDEARAQAALDDASALIRDAVDPVTWVTDGDLDEDIPDIVRTVCLDVAQDRYANPDGHRQETIGNYSYMDSGDAVGGRQLSHAQRAQVRRAAKLSQVGTISLESPYATPGDTRYLEVDPAGEPIPWTRADGW